MDEISSEEDIFGEDSEDEFIPPTSEDSDEGFTFFPRQKKRKNTSYARPAAKRLHFSSPTMSVVVPQEIVSEDNALIPGEERELILNGLEANGPIAFQNDNTPKKKARKVLPKPMTWKCNMRKKAHQAGKAYVNKRGKLVEEKTVKTRKNCANQCKFKCTEKISEQERSDIHVSYYSLPSSTEKRHFIINTTSRMLTARPKRKKEGDIEETYDDFEDEEADHEQNTCATKESRRKFSFKYFFYVKGEKITVCKFFYLGTLAISQKPVYTAHLKKNVVTNTPTADQRGKNEQSRRVPSGDTNAVREHIQSFPVVESYYCKATTSRSYLGSHLTIGKMYELYKDKCNNENIVPVKKSMYYHIFVTEFNLGFHSPKSDRCDLCEKHKVAEKTQTMTMDLQQEYDRHTTLKSQMREVRKEEKEMKDKQVLLFDLENVILTPHADISSFFYLRKLNVYNLTAYYSVTKKTYCAIWSENLSGRAGNDIASAFKKILDVLVEENNITDLVTWSDSCVPQNRNSMISNAVLHFLEENPDVSSVTMKYSLPGHSCVQEVDCAHSAIEKVMRKTDFYSPIGLVRLLKQVSTKNPFKVIQMQPSDFRDYQSTSKLFNYKAIPYTQVACLRFTRTLHVVNFRTSHDKYEPENSVSIRYIETPPRDAKKTKQRETQKKSKKRETQKKTKQRETQNKEYSNVLQVKPKIQKCSKPITEQKKKDIQAAFPFMPLQDRDFYKAILKLD